MGEYIFHFKANGEPHSNYAMHVLGETLEQARSAFEAYYPNADITDITLATLSCEGCEAESCQDCCEHYETDHYICSDCGAELDPGEAIDRAEYFFGDR